MKPSHRNIILSGKQQEELPKCLTQALKIRYEGMDTGDTITDKSKQGNNGTCNGTVGNTTIVNHNCKTFTGEGNISLPINNKTTLTPYYLVDSFSLLTGCHQGIASDSINWYAFHTDTIKKYDRDKKLILTNNHATTDVGVTHLGDGTYHDGKLYVACTNSEGSNYCDGISNPRIGVWNAADLTFIQYYDISESTTEASGCAINADDGYLYTINYCDGTQIWKFSLTDMSFIETITLSESRSGIQGIEYMDGYFFISAQNKIHKYDETGTLSTYPPQGIIYGSLVGGEGLYMPDINTIYCVNDNAGNGEVKKYYKNDTAYTVILWVNLPYLPSEIPAAVMRLWGSIESYNDFYYAKSPAGLYLKANITTSGNRPSILETSGLFKKNQWMMLSVVFEGDAIGNSNKSNIYVDDAQTSATGEKTTALPPYPTGALVIGGESSIAPTYRLLGTLGDFSFFKGKAFSRDEIVRYYNATRHRFGV